MVKQSNTKKQHTTMRGKVIDMDLLRKKNELTPAIGNTRVNARGDELGPGGKIVRKREDIIKEYYEKNPNNVKVDQGLPPSKTLDDSVLKPISKSEPKDEGKPVKKSATPKKSVTLSSKESQELEQFDEDWVEDESGNFVKKETK